MFGSWQADFLLAYNLKEYNFISIQLILIANTLFQQLKQSKTFNLAKTKTDSKGNFQEIKRQLPKFITGLKQKRCL